MEFIIKPGNKIEYQLRDRLVKGSYVVKFITVSITSDKPEDLDILKMHRKKIEKAIVDELNNKKRRK